MIPFSVAQERSYPTDWVAPVLVTHEVAPSELAILDLALFEPVTLELVPAEQVTHDLEPSELVTLDLAPSDLKEGSPGLVKSCSLVAVILHVVLESSWPENLRNSVNLYAIVSVETNTVTTYIFVMWYK